MAVNTRFSFTSEALPDFGRVIYRVPKVGAFTIGFEDHYHLHADRPYGSDGRALHLEYGVHRTGWANDWNPLEEAPSIYGVPLGGGAVFDREKALAWHRTPAEERGPARWLVCRRRKVDGWGGGCAPQATEDRAAHIVAALVDDFLSRPDVDALLLAHRRAKAPGRWHEHQRAIASMNEQIAKLEAERAVEAARADALLDLLPVDLLTPDDASTLV